MSVLTSAVLIVSILDHAPAHSYICKAACSIRRVTKLSLKFVRFIIIRLEINLLIRLRQQFGTKLDAQI